MKLYSRFHIRVKNGKEFRRTTISIETLLVDMFLIKLGKNSGHSDIRSWLQEKQDEQNMSYADSALLKSALMMEIIDPKLVDKYYKRKGD
ncbi:MAG: hypothetical protein EOP48_02765 [Sphingobacteriales bacterium]|nr:MAG: hypothetical protein EOP48_02765 [Sphingobacteriales bacterium]